MKIKFTTKSKKILTAFLLVGITFLAAYLSIPLFTKLSKDIQAIGRGNKHKVSEINYSSDAFNPSSGTKPIVSVAQAPGTISTDTAELVIYSSKKLKQSNAYVLTLTKEDKFFEYKLKLSKLKVGNNKLDLKLTDETGVSASVQVNIFRKSKEAASIPVYGNAKYTTDGNSLTALVSKEYRLSETFVPSGLVSLSSQGIPAKSNIYLRSIALTELSNMVKDMQQAGLDIYVTSAYRSYDNQVTTYNYWVQYNNGSYEEADKISARPGHSEHQLGTTVDFVNSECNYNLTQNFATTKAGKWLAQNSYKYGFVMSYPKGKESITGYSYEPWHFRFVGKANALTFKQSGLTLIEYLKSIN